MPDIRERVEDDRGLIKKIQLKIPGYSGYRRREDIRAADNILRIWFADQVKGLRGGLEGIRDQMAMDGKYQGLQTVGNEIFRLQALEAKIRHAEQGYSGFSAAIRVEEGELDKLYEYDYAMIDNLDKCSSLLPMIAQAGDAVSLNTAVKALHDALMGFEASWDQRMATATQTNVR